MNTYNGSRDLKPIKALLLRHGHTQQELEKLDQDAIIALYEKEIRTDTLNYLHYTNKDSFSMISSLDEANIGDFKIKVQENLEDTLLLEQLTKTKCKGSYA